MNISDCSFHKLPYSKLLTTYIDDFQKLERFFPFNPLDDEDILKRAQSLKNFNGREASVKALAAFHKSLGLKNQQKQLDKLAQDDALVIVTGQQLGMYGGPLFTIYKTITAILLARQYEKKLNVPVVPVFWLADEDHDFEEIAWAGISGKNDFKKIHLNESGNGKPVSIQELDESLEPFGQAISDELFETDFTEKMWKQFRRFYYPGNTYREAFAGLINDWFGKEGLLIAGSNHLEIKKLGAAFMHQSIDQAESIYDAIEEQSGDLEKLFNRQVMNGDSNLFYLSEQEGRTKIHRHEEGWKAGSIKWKEELLLDEIMHSPEKFSPNVFLRPVIQDKMLPTLGYVAGPGELAYFGQMKLLYHQFDLEMPPIFPRFCATIVESGISRIIEKLPFKIHDYKCRLEDLEAEFIGMAEAADLDSLFGNWKSVLNKTAEDPLKVIEEIDPTLKGTVGKTIAGFENELDRLKGRVIRSIKQQQEVQISRIERIKVNLFPDGGLQERALSPIYFINKYGLDFWSEILTEIESKGIDLTKHHFIEL